MSSSVVSQKITNLALYNSTELKSNPFLRHLLCGSEDIKNTLKGAYLLSLFAQMLPVQTCYMHLEKRVKNLINIFQMFQVLQWRDARQCEWTDPQLL